MTDSGRRDRVREAREHIVSLLRAQSAVHADGVRARHRERRQRVRRVLAKRRPPVGEEGHLRDDRDSAGESPRRPHRLGGLEQAPESLEQQKVHARLQQHADLLFEDLADLNERQAPVGLDQGPERTDRSRDERELAGHRFPGDADSFPVDLLQGIAPFVGRQLDAVGVPGVGRQDAGSRVAVVVVHLPDRLGVRQVQRRLGLIGRSPARDEESPHRPVGEKDFLREGFAKILQHQSQDDTPSVDVRLFAVLADPAFTVLRGPPIHKEELP